MIRAAALLPFLAALLSACGMMGGTEPSTGASAGATAGPQDTQLMREIAQANLTEIATGRLAAQKAQAAPVRQFGQRMVDDHTRLLQEGRQLAAAKDIAMPQGPDPKYQALLQKLEAMPAERFDRTYMEHMVQDHQNTLQLLKRTSSQAQDAALRAHAQKAVPIVENHLEAAKRITSEIIGKES